MTQLGVLARRIIEQESEPERQLQKLGHDLIDIIARHKAELTVCFREIQSLTGERREKVLALHAAYERIWRSEEHTSELQSLMRISYAVFCLKQKKQTAQNLKTPLLR